MGPIYHGNVSDARVILKKKHFIDNRLDEMHKEQDEILFQEY